MTRLAETAAQGHVLDAAAADPVGVVLLGVLGLLAVVGLLARSGLRVPLPPRATRLVPLGLVGVLAVRWASLLTGVTAFSG